MDQFIPPNSSNPLLNSFPQDDYDDASRTRTSSKAASRLSRTPSDKSTSRTTTITSTIQKPPIQSALELTSNSPPLTSFLHDRYSASSAAEESYLRTSFRLRMARIVISVLTLAMSVSTLGLSGATLHEYHYTKMSAGWHLDLWPVDLDLKPTVATLVPAAIIAVGGIFYLAVSAIPSPRSHTTLQTHLFTLLTLTTLLLTLFSVIFTQVLLHHVNPTINYRDSIQSFTCRFYRRSRAFNNDMEDLLGVALAGGVTPPQGFGKVCREAEAAGGLMAAVLGLSLLGVAIGVWGALAKRGIEAERKRRWGEKYALSVRE